jgi:hypothetical protein
VRANGGIRLSSCAAVVAVVAIAIGTSGCGGSTQSSSLRVQRHAMLVGAPACAPGEIVERDLEPAGWQYRCVAPNPAQPASANPDVQQGDPCDDFGATVSNKQGLVFDCEPWGPNEGMRWIRP